ncbi:WD40-repeat-containing domain protein [Suillus ampliporus]|nr:WD40-repeat-containing domain protein [Suillus ampliporus]
MIAVGGYNESGIKIWDANMSPGQLLSTIEVIEGVWSLAWTSDEKKLISGTGRSGSISIFDTATWQQIGVLKGHTNTVSAITLFRNDRLLASASWDRTARLWNLDTNLPVGPPLEHEDEDDMTSIIGGAAFSADGKLLATTCDDENVYVWDIYAILNVAGLEDLLFIPDATKDGSNKSLLDADATRRPAPHCLPPGFFNDAQNRVHSSATRSFHPHSSAHRRRSALASSSGSGLRTLLSRLPSLFRRSQPNDVAMPLPQHQWHSTSSSRGSHSVEVAAQRDKKALYVAPRRPETASDKARRIKNPNLWPTTFATPLQPGHHKTITDDKAAASHSGKHAPRIVDSHDVCWSPDGERVVSGSTDRMARVWNVKNGEPVLGLNPIKTGHRDVYAVSYSPNATMIATGGYIENGIKIWDAKTSPGQLLSTIQVRLAIAMTVWSLAWTSDEKKLIAGAGSSPIRIFDTATWQQIAVLDGHTNTVSAITLFRNDRLLASASWDRTACLWNLNTNLPVGPPLIKLKHENKMISTSASAAFSSDGKLLVTTCYDNNAYVWDVHAVLNAAGLEDLLSIPDAPKDGLMKKMYVIPFLTVICDDYAHPSGLPQRFFDDAPNRVRSSATGHLHPHPSAHRRRGALASSSGSGPHTLLGRLPFPFRRSKSNAAEATELQQHPRRGTSSHHSPGIVDVAAIRDKQALYVARRPETASDKAKRIKNPKWWVRVVLFLCCVSPATDDSNRNT